MNNPLIFHSRGKAGQPRVTIAASVTSDGMQFSASRCSKNDSFLKKKGRALAIERLDTQPIITISGTEIGWLTLAKAIAKIVRDNPQLIKNNKDAAKKEA